jgi:hypothetical protein
MVIGKFFPLQNRHVFIQGQVSSVALPVRLDFGNGGLHDLFFFLGGVCCLSFIPAPCNIRV